MELLTGGNRRDFTSSDFPEQISPFPAAESFLVTNSMSMIHSSTQIDCQNSPPQKLRPIRANGRSPSSSQANDIPFSSSSGGLDGTLENLGLLVDQVCGVNGEGNEFFKPPVKAEEVSGPQGTGSGGSALVEGNLDPTYEGGLSEDESSSSDDDSSAGVDGCGNRKRKRKARKKIEDFLESLVMKVLEKQEQMYKQLIETMERREQERVIKEEAWKQQEIERMKRDEEVRAQENARSLALLSFIQDVMGHKVETPQTLTTTILHPDKNEKRDGSNISIQKDINGNSSNRRWPKAEVQALIMLRAAFEQKFRVMGSKCYNIWDEISAGMYSMGYNRTAKKCKEKWENINKYFRKSVGSGGKKPYENSMTCPYFNELHVLYNNGYVVNPEIAPHHTKTENDIYTN